MADQDDVVMTEATVLASSGGSKPPRNRKRGRGARERNAVTNATLVTGPPAAGVSDNRVVKSQASRIGAKRKGQITQKWEHLALQNAHKRALEKNLSAKDEEVEYLKLLKRYVKRDGKKMVRKVQQAVKAMDPDLSEQQLEWRKSPSTKTLSNQKRAQARRTQSAQYRAQSAQSISEGNKQLIRILRRNLDNLRATFGVQSDHYQNFKLMVETTIKELEARISERRPAESSGLMHMDLVESHRGADKSGQISKDTVTEDAGHAASDRMDEGVEDGYKHLASVDRVTDENDNSSDDDEEDGGVLLDDIGRGLSSVTAQPHDGLSSEEVDVGYLQELRLLLGEMSMDDSHRTQP